jgi:hypothetical protein
VSFEWSCDFVNIGLFVAKGLSLHTYIVYQGVLKKLAILLEICYFSADLSSVFSYGELLFKKMYSGWIV